MVPIDVLYLHTLFNFLMFQMSDGMFYGVYSEAVNVQTKLTSKSMGNKVIFSSQQTQ